MDSTKFITSALYKRLIKYSKKNFRLQQQEAEDLVSDAIAYTVNRTYNDIHHLRQSIFQFINHKAPRYTKRYLNRYHSSAWGTEGYISQELLLELKEELTWGN